MHKKNIIQRSAQRGATMVSVSLLSVAMVSASLLLVRQANRSATESGVVVARERALLAAQAGAELATAYYRERQENDQTAVTTAITGIRPASDPDRCESRLEDCIPGLSGTNAPTTGIRQHDTTLKQDCAGRLCMRPGAIAVLPDATGGADVLWVQIPLSELVLGGDDQALVSVWVRNNAGEALDSNDATNWVTDEDGHLVITASAEVFGAQATVEKTVALVPVDGNKVWQMASPDLAYGGGHNNDNVAVETCSEGNSAVATP